MSVYHGTYNPPTYHGTYDQWLVMRSKATGSPVATIVAAVHAAGAVTARTVLLATRAIVARDGLATPRDDYRHPDYRQVWPTPLYLSHALLLAATGQTQDRSAEMARLYRDGGWDSSPLGMATDALEALAIRPKIHEHDLDSWALRVGRDGVLTVIDAALETLARAEPAST